MYIESSQALQEMSKPAQNLDFFSFCFKYEKADKECSFIYLYFPKRSDGARDWKPGLVISGCIFKVVPET